jgi:Holliday junction resolvasome RuvABC DNA-binding subunit
MKQAITEITGIGPAAAAALGEQGFDSVRALARASVEQVSAVPGFSAARAQKVITAAADLLATSTAETATSDKPEKVRKDKKDKKKKDKKDKKKKDKKDKKDKGKNKK